ncbi:MAG: hypothetical protein K0U78_16380 [Actinomycetia bacterium]|nr:hypothetical protein [Actinomycetes bacterium]
MGVSAHVSKGDDRVGAGSRGGNVWYDRLVETVEELGDVENIFCVELGARWGSRRGKFGDTGIVIHVVEEKSGNEKMQVQLLASPDELVEHIWEAAFTYSDLNGGPFWFQARFWPRVDGDRGKTYVPVSFELGAQASSNTNDDEMRRNLESLTRTVRSLERTTTNILDRFGELLKEGGRPDAEWAKVQIELKKMEHEAEEHRMFFELIDKRTEQLVRELAPGIRDNIATEPLRHNYPDRWRAWLESLTEEEDRALRDIITEDVYSLIRGAADAATNVDARACVQVLNDKLAVMKKATPELYEEKLQEIRDALPDRYHELSRLLELA